MAVPTIKLNNNVVIPQLGLGVWKASDDEAEHAVGEALKAGYRLIDTAAVYGNEKGVGKAIRNSTVARKDLFVTTKVWNSDQGFESTKAAFEKSLEKLGLDYVDLYLIHWPMPKKERFVETWRALEELNNDKKVRAIGVCNFNQDHLERLMSESNIVPAVNQIEIHPDFQQTELRQFCFEHGIAVESWSPIGQGGDMLHHPVLIKIAEFHGKSPAQVALRWHIQSGLITIPKSVHTKRIQENIDVFDFELSEEDMGELFTMDAGHRMGPDPVTLNN